MLIFARPRRTSTGRPPPRRTCRGRSKRQWPRGCAANGARPRAPCCTRAAGWGTLPWHRPGRVCRTKTPVALSSRAHRDNAAVHPSVTRRHCRVVPGSNRSCTRGAPGAHKGNTQGAAGSRPGRARVEPHRLHFRRKFSSWWRHGPRFAPRLAFRARRNPETAAYHVQLLTDRRSDSPPVRRFPRPEGFFESRPEGG